MRAKPGLCSTYSSLTRSGPVDEDRVRVRRVDDLVDLDSKLLGLVDVVRGRLDAHGQMVQQRPLGLGRVALMKLDEGATDLDTVGAGRAGLRRVEAERDVLLGRGCRVGRVERDVVEVELDLGGRLDQAEA